MLYVEIVEIFLSFTGTRGISQWLLGTHYYIKIKDFLLKILAF